jgi:hypothetical protein
VLPVAGSRTTTVTTGRYELPQASTVGPIGRACRKARRSGNGPARHESAGRHTRNHPHLVAWLKAVCFMPDVGYTKAALLCAMKPGVHFHREALRLVLVNGSSMLTHAPVAPTLMKEVPVFGSECIEVLGRDPTTHPAWKEAAAAQSQASDTRAALVSRFKLRYGKKLDEDIAAEKAAVDAAKAKQRPSLLSVLASKNVQLDSAVLAAMKRPAAKPSPSFFVKPAAAKNSQ